MVRVGMRYSWWVYSSPLLGWALKSLRNYCRLEWGSKGIVAHPKRLPVAFVGFL